MTDSAGGDMGVEAIREMHRIWLIDEERCVWVGDRPSATEPYGFDWWPGDFKVSVRAFGPHPEISEPQYRINVVCDFLTDVDVAAPGFAERLSDFSFSCQTFAPVAMPKEILREVVGRYGVDAEPQRLSLESVIYLNESTAGWWPRFIAALSLLQPFEAQLQESTLPKLFGGRPEKSKCPHAPPDIGWDDMLNAWKGYAEHGKQPSCWTGTGEFESIVEQWAKFGVDTAVGFADRNGLMIETPFGDKSAMLRMNASQPHPLLGSGLRVFLELPLMLPAEQAFEQAQTLNFWEARRWNPKGMAFVGGWTAHAFPAFDPDHPEGGQSIGGKLGRWARNLPFIGKPKPPRNELRRLAHSVFIPDLLYQNYLATNLARYGLARARWARQMLLPGVKDLTMHELLVRQGMLPASVLEEKERGES